MSDWYYATGSQQHGPLSAEDLASLLRSGQINRETRIWREGMSEWRPLHERSGELGLGEISASGPPPIPFRAASAQSAMAAPVKKTGLSGGMITLIVIAVAAIPALMVMAILAAIAIPAYQDYVVRSKVLDASTVGAQFKPHIAEFREQSGNCPGDEDMADALRSGYSSAHVSSVAFGEFDDGNCGIELHLDATGNAAVDGLRLWFDYDPGTQEWTCSSEVADRHLPINCQG